MNILHLPEEILTLIFTYLDTKSKIIAYSIIELKQFFAPCLMRKVNISRSTVAASKTLRLDVLQDYAGNIQELNLSGIQDLTADQLFPYLQKCTNLKTLDVTFTRIFLPDVEHICCASLKNISINYFRRPRKHSWVWKKCSDIFKRQKFESVHFVVLKFYDSESPLRFMKYIPMTKDLKITLADNYRAYSEVEERHHSSIDVTESIDIHFEHLCYVYRDCRVLLPCRTLKGISNLDYKKIEYIFIMYLEIRICIYVSPIFSPMFGLNCAHLTIHICSRLPDFLVDGNIIFKAWNKEATVFDDGFFRNVLSELTDYFPTYICMHTMVPMRITEAPSHWYCIDPCDTFDGLIDNLPQNVTLSDFCRHDSVVRLNRPVTLKPLLKSMKNITFLSIYNICTKEEYFFPFLFLQCKKLYTLDVFVENRRGSYPYCTLSLLNSIHLTNSLKNLKLTLEDINYEKIFFSLCQCSSLENIHICEYERVLADFKADEQNIMSLIEKCCNLYSLFIEADMDSEALTILMGTLRTAAESMGRDHLCLDVCYCYSGWNPFADVFNPSPVRIPD